MDLKLVQKIIPEIVAKTANDGGATYDFRTLSFVEPEDYWYFPKYPDLTEIVSEAALTQSLFRFIYNNQYRVLEKDTVFGTWVNPSTNKVYIDINMFRYRKNEAISVAKELSKTGGRKIVSIYNPYQNKTEYIEH